MPGDSVALLLKMAGGISRSVIEPIVELVGQGPDGSSLSATEFQAVTLLACVIFRWRPADRFLSWEKLPPPVSIPCAPE